MIHIKNSSERFIKTGPVKRKSSVSSVRETFDWDLFERINSTLIYSNVVLNDLEIFQTAEIYSTFMK